MWDKIQVKAGRTEFQDNGDPGKMSERDEKNYN